MTDTEVLTISFGLLFLVKYLPSNFIYTTEYEKVNRNEIVECLDTNVSKIPGFAQLEWPIQTTMVLYAYRKQCRGNCISPADLNILLQDLGVSTNILELGQLLHNSDEFMTCLPNGYKLTRTCEDKIANAIENLKSSQNDVQKSSTSEVIPRDLVENTRGYLDAVANEINGCYERGWYNACAVMMRRLMEMLLIEALEAKGAENIKKDSGDYVSLDALVGFAKSGTPVTISRDPRNNMDNFKKLGDSAAHVRRFVAKKEDIDKYRHPFRVMVEELLVESGIKK